MQQDPDGYYARLGVAPTATPAAILAAWRRQARRLHPDVPVTGSTQAFVALKAAYDVLSDPAQRRAYDRRAAAEVPRGWPAAAPPFSARAPDASAPFAPAPDGMTSDGITPDGMTPGTAAPAPGTDLRFFLWIGFLVASAAGAGWLMLAISRGPTASLGTADPPPAATAEAAGAPSSHLPRARPAGRPNHYVLPGLGAAWVWRRDPHSGGHMRPMAELPAFAPVEVRGLDPASGRMEIRLAGGATGFVSGARLAAGDAAAAHLAMCADRAGPPPASGEVLARGGTGSAWMTLRNSNVEPVVVKLRNPRGQVVASVFLSPGAHVVLRGLPPGPWITDFAVGEFWSRACRIFAAGERAQRFRRAVGSGSVVDLPPDLPPPAMPVDIPDSQFARP